MNVGGHGKSRQQGFEKNGISGKKLLRHHDFIKYLRYFIHGPNLPQDTIRGFCNIIKDDAGTSGMVLKQVESYVRKEVKAKGLPRTDAAEEFFKLAHEIDRPDLAENVRSAAKDVRK